uniref:NADH-ubiquinone oxidoreductase chain 3 n=1 Tax=Ophiacantha linea TaxID=1357420 RepID=V9NJN5_9ECHI|nr:NADH dehydrogenase subunit 3 [Ophiacantha linea]AGQ49783.1 NADH dehydrogenase subunit 3 [Ophiacantha linea]
MNLLINYFIIVIILTIILSSIGQTIPLHLPDFEKSAPYECGFDPINSSRLPFSFRFFLVAILFLIFDLEIALLLPLPFTTAFSNNQSSFLFIILFIIILIIGLWYEWIKGGLDWANTLE